jgi:16S rRNA (uracil1498-N3)-methyltransferase
MEYYYTQKENVDLKSNVLTVDDFEYRHLIKVLRKKTGDKITVTDGQLTVYHCEIISINKDRLSCRILETQYDLNEPKIKLSLFLSPLRNQTRFEFVIEKAVELGVSSIHPVITEFTVNKNLNGKSKTDRLKKIIIAAMGQSQRCLLPELRSAVTFDEMIEQTRHTGYKIVMYESSNDETEISLAEGESEVSLLIGPEGGFSEAEIITLKQAGWKIKSLGRRKFRSETAAIVSVYNIITKQNHS